jgi:hypothetical protein
VVFNVLLECVKAQLEFLCVDGWVFLRKLLVDRKGILVSTFTERFRSLATYLSIENLPGTQLKSYSAAHCVHLLLRCLGIAPAYVFVRGNSNS